MKVALLLLNSMFLLLFISIIIGEWGDSNAIVAGISTFMLLLNSAYILLRAK